MGIKNISYFFLLINIVVQISGMEDLTKPSQETGSIENEIALLKEVVKAIESNNNNKLKKLLDNPSIDVTMKDDRGNYPLEYAVRKNNLKAARMLLDKSADSDIFAKIGDTILDYPAHNGYAKMLDLLFSSIPKEDRRQYASAPLMSAINGKHSQIVKMLLPFVDINASIGSTILLIAAVEKEDPQAVEILLEANADPNMKDKYGLTAFDEAKKIKDPQIKTEITNLLNKAAGITVEQPAQHTPPATQGSKVIVPKYGGYGKNVDSKIIVPQYGGYGTKNN